jgi:hypothetical protein
VVGLGDDLQELSEPERRVSTPSLCNERKDSVDPERISVVVHVPHLPHHERIVLAAGHVVRAMPSRELLENIVLRRGRRQSSYTNASKDLIRRGTQLREVRSADAHVDTQARPVSEPHVPCLTFVRSGGVLRSPRLKEGRLPADGCWGGGPIRGAQASPNSELNYNCAAWGRKSLTRIGWARRCHRP